MIDTARPRELALPAGRPLPSAPGLRVASGFGTAPPARAERAAVRAAPPVSPNGDPPPQMLWGED